MRAISLVSIGNILVIILGAVITKIIATRFGPEVLAVFSQYRNVGQLLIFVITLNSTNTIIRNLTRLSTAHRSIYYSLYLQSVLFVTILTSVVVSIIVLKSETWVSSTIFFDSSIAPNFVTRSLMVFAVLGSLSVFYGALLRSKGLHGKFLFIQAIGSLSSLSVIVFLSERIGNVVVFIIPILPFLFFLLALARDVTGVVKDGPFNWNIFKRVNRLNQYRFIRMLIKSHISFSSVSFFSSTLGVLVLITSRGHIADIYGVEFAGNFDAAWSLSVMGSAFVLSVLTATILPKISTKISPQTLASILNKYYSLIFPFVLIGIVVVVLLPNSIINLFYSSDFEGAVEFIKILVIAEFVKIASFYIGLVFIAKGLSIAFLLLEIISQSLLFISFRIFEGNFVYLGFVILFINIFIFMVSAILIYRKSSLILSIQFYGRFLLGLAILLSAYFL